MPTLHRAEIEVSTTDRTDIVDLTGEIERFVAGTGVGEGWVLVFVPGSTGGVTTIEYESGCLEDLRAAFERLAPRDGDYAHNLRWGDGNGFSHVRAALLGPSLTLPVHAGRVIHGTWQQIVLCDFDNKARERRVLIEVMAG